jgi:hypothetical protein
MIRRRASDGGWMPEPGAKEVEQLGGCLRERNQTLYRIGGVTERGVGRTGEGSRWPYYQVEERGTGCGGRDCWTSRRRSG